jgi:K+-transporting ATPase KdpF subunit
MKKIFTHGKLLALLLMPLNHESAASDSTHGYLIGGIIALLIMGYLIYTLMHPDKF